MATNVKDQGGSGMTSPAEGAVNDLQKLIGQHFELLRGDLNEGLADIKDAGLSLGAGAGAAAAGSLLGILALVHLLHGMTRLPLWACYGLVGGGLGIAGSKLVRRGVRQAADVELFPRKTAEVLKQELAGSSS